MLSGEMGRSIFGYPVSYLKLMSKYRGSLAKDKTPGTVKMGVALHWNKVCGDCFDMPRTNSYSLYNTTYHQIWEAQKDQIMRTFDVPMIRRVFETSDVLGISHYAPSPHTGVNAGSFAMPIDTTAFELAHWGIDLKVGVGTGGAWGAAWWRQCGVNMQDSGDGFAGVDSD